MFKNLIGLITGLIFGFGLALSGMTQPQKVLAFLDVAGQWDPSLLYVLGGAVGVTLISFRFILRLHRPVLESRFFVADENKIDRPLVLGAIIFGAGWGIAGYCPGPAVTLFAAPSWELYAFVPAMLVGIFLQKNWSSQYADKAVVPEIENQNDCS